MSDATADDEQRTEEQEEATSRGDGAGSEEASASENEGQGESGGGEDGQTEEEKQVEQEMKKIEEDPPERLEDWPQGKAKYETFGGPEGEHGYHEGAEGKLGPSSLRHHEGGEVSVEGEKVENPDEYKGEPIPGGPTDPNAPDTSVEDSEGDGEEEG